jgi:hypothetical protein
MISNLAGKLKRKSFKASGIGRAVHPFTKSGTTGPSIRSILFEARGMDAQEKSNPRCLFSEKSTPLFIGKQKN